MNTDTGDFGMHKISIILDPTELCVYVDKYFPQWYFILSDFS